MIRNITGLPKKLSLIALLLSLRTVAAACDVCNKQQPEILQGIAHGAGPENNWDYVIVWSTVVIVIFTLYFSIKWLLRPGEKSKEHIKRLILNID